MKFDDMVSPTDFFTIVVGAEGVRIERQGSGEDSTLRFEDLEDREVELLHSAFALCVERHFDARRAIDSEARIARALAAVGELSSEEVKAVESRRESVAAAAVVDLRR